MDTDQGALQLVRSLRWSLRHLYNPEQLALSPLVQLLDLGRQADGKSLREVLLEAIDGLRPSSDVPAQNKAWRVFGALYYRYVDQFAQHEVAKTLGLSVRQLRRQEHLAMCVLADQLWVRYGPKAGTDKRSPGIVNTPALSSQRSPSGITREQELDWLHDSAAREPVDVLEIVRSAVRTVTPLSTALRVPLDCQLPEGLPRLNVLCTSARQALVAVLSVAIRAGSSERVTITAGARQRWVNIGVVAGGQRAAEIPGDLADSVEMARQLSEVCGGKLEVVWGEGTQPAFSAVVSLPVVEDAKVLIVDDNADSVQLFERYLASTSYSCVSSTDPREALALAQELRPCAIVLDVMMPGLDGWELLERLREDPDTSGIPVIVCTILPEAQLALTLGAAEFLRKPVNRAQLMSALERLAEREQPESPAPPG